MKVWTIKHKPTGAFMPARMYRTAYSGWSYWKPAETREGYKPHDANPRVFFTLQGARNALTAWLAGEWKREQGVTSSYFDPEPYDDLSVSAPAVARRREDMEIVEGELVLP